MAGVKSFAQTVAVGAVGQNGKTAIQFRIFLANGLFWHDFRLIT
jgi:hypothetical protein